jgi:hypothetical protein
LRSQDSEKMCSDGSQPWMTRPALGPESYLEFQQQRHAR